MELRELRYFVAAFEEGSLTAAARRCLISQPSISGALAAIEAELGVRLFTRHKKGVTPTSAAELLYPKAKRLVEEEVAVRNLFTTEAPDETFTLGLLRSLDVARTTRLLAPIAAMPGVKLQLVDPHEPVDARIIEKRMLTESESFHRLWRERFVLALPARHPLAIAAPVRDEDLRELPFISRCHCEVAAFVGNRGPKARTVAVADSEEWALALVRAGVGVTILPEGSVDARSDVVIRPLASHNLVREIGIAHGDKRMLSPRGYEVVARLRALARSP